jgi:hypothetical protein
VIAGTFVVLAVLAVIAGVIDFTRPVDDPVYPFLGGAFTPLALWTVIFGFVAYKTFSGRLFADYRWRRIDRELAAEGFRRATEREIDETAGIPVLILRMLGTDRGGGVDHVAVGSVAGREVRAFRARIRGRGTGRWVDVPIVAVRVPAHLACTIIRPARRGLRPAIAMRRVTFELERFNRSIEVHSIDRFFATAMLDPRMMEWLERHLGRTVIELADGWVVAWSNALRGSPASPLDLIEELAAFSDHIPRSIPSFFPRRHGSQEWIHRGKRAGRPGWLDRMTTVSDAPAGRNRDSEPPRLPAAESERL